MLRTIDIVAGVGQNIRVAGKLFRLTYKSDATANLQLSFINGAGNESPAIIDAPKGFRYAPAEGFSGVRVTSDKNIRIIVLITDGWADIDLDLSGATVTIGNDCTNPIPITTCSGVPLETTLLDQAGNPTGVSGNPLVVTTTAGVAAINKHYCTRETVQTLANGGTTFSMPANTKRFQIRNLGNENIVIEPDNGTGAPTGNGVILIKPDEFWSESEIDGNPAWTWFAYSDLNPVTVNIEIIEKV